jgi:acyl carrier protein
MTRSEQLAALRADVDALFHADEATVLAALPQWDSLAILLVVSHFEHVHDREITGAQVRACRTVADILNLNNSLS